MQVSLQSYKSKEGLVAKKTVTHVDLQVIFSEEEKQTIKEQRLGDFIIVERKHGSVFSEVRVSYFLDNKRDSYTFKSGVDAKHYIDEIKTSITDFKKLFSSVS